MDDKPSSAHCNSHDRHNAGCQACRHAALDAFAKRIGPPQSHVEGREAPMEACEIPASSGGAAWAATVEACARAGVGVWNDPTSALGTRWDAMTEGEREMWRKVARAVLAAAKGAGR